jgi:hypothetical protein
MSSNGTFSSTVEGLDQLSINNFYLDALTGNLLYLVYMGKKRW